jgi:PKD repeat protein
MRSIRLLAVATTVVVLGSACGGDPPTGDDNVAPVAIFTAPTNCTVGVACAFSATPSTDDKAVTGWAWDFNGDATADFTTQDASFAFAAAGSVPVRLIVSDAEGLADTVTNNVTVAPATPGNTAPTASFVLPTDCVAGTPCGFHSSSTDTEDGTITATNTDWNFGDTETGEGIDVTHTYAAAGTYTVTLTVTDNAGATATANQQLVVSPAASQDCTTSGTLVDCSLTITQPGSVKIVVVSEACELAGNKLTVNIPGQAEQTAFFNLCNAVVGAEYIVKDATGVTPLVFTAGSTLPLRFHQGPQGTNPPVSDPGIRVTGNYASGLLLNVDDGGAAGTPGEPDFNDVVLRVERN